jgi:hypothetical protein
MNTIVLTVIPSREADGRCAYSTRGQLFDAAVDGRVITKRSTIPLLEAARVLAGEGVAPRTRLVMRHAGSGIDAAVTTVGYAAGRTVTDDSVGKPVFRAWTPSPFDGGSAVPVKAPMRQTEEVALG